MRETRPLMVFRKTLPYSRNTFASYRPSCPKDGHLVSIASKTSGKQMRKVDFLRISARLQKTTNRETILPNTCYLGLGLSICCILQMWRLFCQQTSKVASSIVINIRRDSRAYQILRGPDCAFGARREIFAPLLGNGIFTQEGSAWKHLCESNLFVFSTRT